MLGRHAVQGTLRDASVSGRAYPLRLDGMVDPALGRWQWLVKWFLAIPHLFVLGLLWVAVLVLTLVAGCCILVTGRYPRSIFDFNVGVLRWTWRVQYFGFSVLATDEYPPFSLGREDHYPADLYVEYPVALSRPLVLVKSWLLALPHLVLVVVIAGIPLLMTRELPWSLLSEGLLGLLTLAAMIVLAATGRYPAALFGFVMGLNRWVYRVLAYVLLMTDEYPPFRLDAGGTDPAGVVEYRPALRTSAAPARTRAAERRAGVVLTIVGSVLVAGAFAMWWLVATTNTEGDRGDPQLLPVLAAIPLVIGIYHLVHAHIRGRPS
jgi:hypothetical protein